MQFEEYALRLNASDFASRSKAKAKPQRRESAGSSTRKIPIGERTWTDVEPGEYSLSEYEVSKKVIYLLRHSQQVHREEDGAFHFWRIKENLQNQFPQIPHWSDDRWKACLAAGGGNKKRHQHCTDSSGIIVFYYQYIYHSGLIPGGQNSSKRQTVFFLPVDPMNKNHEDPDTIDLNVPRHA